MSNPLSRREFLETLGATAAVVALPGALVVAQTPTETAEPWFTHAYRRAVIDMHIPDWDPAFLSKFDPNQYADMLVKSHAQSIVCYCQSHVGLFNFPTKVGHEHKAFSGRNMLGEMIDACHKRNIAVQLYTSLIFDRTAGDDHPEWRMRTWEGKIQGEGGRHAVLCVNSPYREYVRSFVTEICKTFDFEGIRFDMTFWPWLCFCEHCQQRFDAEVGGEIPKTINWLDEKWVAFQRRREAWLVEFAKIATDTVRELKPKTTVEHQASTFPLNWMFGVTAPLAAQNDFLQGDFYGDQLQGSFVRKLLEDLTPRRPFGYETSFSVSLQDHTARKPTALLEAKASAAIADHAAFIFIDAIDPIGTVNPNPHERMGKVFEKLMPYYDHLGGQRVRDVAIYYSPESKFSFYGNGRPVANPDTSDTHTSASMQAARRMIEAHIPLGVVTKADLLKWKTATTRLSELDLEKPGAFESLPGLTGVRVLILASVNMLDPEEADAIRAWVRAGGRVYASAGTSIVDTNGRQQQDFQLSNVFGTSLVETFWSDRPRFLAPTKNGSKHFVDFDADYPAFVTNFGMRIKAADGAQVLATTTRPWPAPDGTKFASIHSNPPWEKTDEPEIVRNSFGRGEAIYSASPIELVETLGDTFTNLIRQLLPRQRMQVDAPKCVEATIFDQPDRKRFILSLVSFQKDLPNIPIDGISVMLNLDRKIEGVTLLPGNDNVPMERRQDGAVIFTVPRLDTLRMLAVTYS
jgi:hypothetical protein